MRKREGLRNEASRRERGKTVGLVTQCVLLLLYGGLLHHQNIKCPVGKRACAWVHPHFTFTADCRINWATFPRFLAPENVLVRPSRILFCSLLPSLPPHSKRGHWLSLAASLFRPAVKFILFLISYSEFCSLHRNLYISSSESLFSALTEARSLSGNHHLKIYHLKNTSKKCCTIDKCETNEFYYTYIMYI